MNAVFPATADGDDVDDDGADAAPFRAPQQPTLEVATRALEALNRSADLPVLCAIAGQSFAARAAVVRHVCNQSAELAAIHAHGPQARDVQALGEASTAVAASLLMSASRSSALACLSIH